LAPAANTTPLASFLIQLTVPRSEELSPYPAVTPLVTPLEPRAMNAITAAMAKMIKAGTPILIGAASLMIFSLLLLKSFSHVPPFTNERFLGTIAGPPFHKRKVPRDDCR